jgi:hypothetical protein
VKPHETGPAPLPAWVLAEAPRDHAEWSAWLAACQEWAHANGWTPLEVHTAWRAASEARR